MASPLTPDDVARIAALAHLEISPAERETFTRQLADILTYAAIVQQVDTTSVEPAGPEGPVGPAGPEGPAEPEPGRADLPAPSVLRDEVLGQAPDGVPTSGLFRVPKVL